MEYKGMTEDERIHIEDSRVAPVISFVGVYIKK